MVAAAAGAAGLTRTPAPAPTAVARAEPQKTPEPKLAPGPHTAPGPTLRQVLIATEPVAAQIFKGSESLGMSPVSVTVAEGQSVELSIKAQGFKDSRVIVDGSESSQSIKLDPMAPVRGAKPAKAATTSKTSPASGKRPSLGGGELVDPWSK